jgi:tetratricopeptide (TPR) repeat protein
VWFLSAIFMISFIGLSAPRILLTQWNVLQNWDGVGQFLGQVAQPEQRIVVYAESSYARAMQHYLPEFNVVQHDPQLPLGLIMENEQNFWLIFVAKERYDDISQTMGDHGYVELIFRGGWHPDMDQATDLRPPFSWDLILVYVNRDITELDDALAFYEAWIPQIDTQFLRFHLSWARAYQRFDRCDLAIPEYTQGLKEGHVNHHLASTIYNARGVCWYRLGKAERAISDWQQAIVHGDWNQEPYKQLGNAYLEMEEVEKARELYQAAKVANPRRAWPHVLLGEVFRISGMDEDAISEYRQAIETEPDNPAAYGYLGQMYSAVEEAKVISLYQEAIRLNPSYAWPHLQLGRFYQSVFQIEEAIYEFQRAVELQPEYEFLVSGLLHDCRWDLESVISSIDAYSDQGEFLWWLDRSWVKPYPDEGIVMIGTSTLTVEGQVRPHQLFIHPFGDQDNTYLGFQIPNNPFAYLEVGYGLADKVAGLTNGVEYTIEVRKQGTDRYEPLFSQKVTQNVWQNRKISLAPYWGEDLDFRLVVDAQGDYTYDWLQTTVELTPPLNVVWDLSANLAKAQFNSNMLFLEWGGDGFFTPDGIRLLGISKLPVGGRSLTKQVHLHPYGSNIDSTLSFTLPRNPYRSLKMSYGLADQALPHSNGVDYTVSVSVDGGTSFIDLVQTTVITSTWHSVLVDLPSSQDLVLKLNSSARQDATFDWLQVSLALLPFDASQEASLLTDMK